MIFFYALLLVLFGLTLILSIISIASMFVIGYKQYILQIKSLIGFRADKIFLRRVSSTITYSHSSTVYTSPISDDYYYFVYMKSDIKILMIKAYYSFLPFFSIDVLDKINGEWIYKEVKISPNICIFTGLLKDRISNILKKSVDKAIPVENVEDISDFINNQLTQIYRDKKLKTILDE